MRTEIDDAEFWRQLDTFQQSAFRLEQQPAYEVDYEDEVYASFLRGRPVPPTDSPALADWMKLVARHTGHGRTMSRVRIVDDPITDYQRWLRWGDWWNVEAGEVIRYLPRALAIRGGLFPPAEGPDWWLFDDRRLMLTCYDSEHRRTGIELVEDDPLVQRAREWRAVAIALARTAES
ncbi:hypothetical protein GCM10010172_07120 [Paractinoplanes ferrugineus]|uniref:DUF6879 domain-containing protein n=1 Tax=Paractinoplanes ferrugineus TaxID=113564 RepID=A0A919JCI4_9ACTN|nr:DUF6879 family protein [Actinoplanes ferrugineus]GIE16809.1 hypothetical protein Afe05nite_86490 [Actinoplanes ferrugineus]